MIFDLSDWLVQHALPLWAERGFDPSTGLFHEVLDFDARALTDSPLRLLVQARQIFVFTVAHANGWFEGLSEAVHAGEAMIRHFRSDGHPGFAFSVGRAGKIIDYRRDLYSHAFVLLALAHLADTTGDQRWRAIADHTLCFLDENLRASAGGGYAESTPLFNKLRRQNPHMHMLEALLALENAVGGRDYLKRADAIVALLVNRFLHGPKRVLVEDYEHDFAPIGGQPFRFEPGHHFEWCWLLHKHAELHRRAPPAIASQMATTALESVAQDGTIYDEVSETGLASKLSSRLWPHSEACRTLCLSELRTPHTAAAKRAIFAKMHTSFIAPTMPGLWIDRLDERGSAISKHVPASSLYHIAACAAQLCYSR